MVKFQDSRDRISDLTIGTEIFNIRDPLQGVRSVALLGDTRIEYWLVFHFKCVMVFGSCLLWPRYSMNCGYNCFKVLNL